MNRSLRSIAFTAGVALALVSSACQSDVKPVADALAQDSTLALDVLGANQDTALVVDLSDVGAPIEPSVAAALPLSSPAVSVPEVSQPRRVLPSPARVAQSDETPRRARASVQRVGRSPRTVQTVNAQRTTGDSRRVTDNEERTTRVISAPSRAWMVLPVGSELELEADQRICSNTALAGDVFNATITEPVIRANGTVIPGGSSARAEVLSAGPNADSRMAIRIQSILIGGRTYQVSSRVTYAEVKKVRTRSGSGSAGRVATGAAAGAVLGQVLGRNTKSTVIGAAGGAIGGAVLASRNGRVAQCLPDGGRITAELTEPLRILLSD